MRVSGNGHGVCATIPESIARTEIITCIATSTYIVTIVGLELAALCLGCKLHTQSNTRSLTIVLRECHCVSLTTTCRDGQAGARTGSLKPKVAGIALISLCSVDDEADSTIECLSYSCAVHNSNCGSNTAT